MTCREKLKIEKPHMIQRYCCGGCFGCPHEYGYLDRPDYCPPSSGSDDEKCSKCWNREIPGTEDAHHTAVMSLYQRKALEHVINNEEKDMELNEKFAKMTFAELVDTAAGYEKEIEDLREDNTRLGTMISNREDVIEKRDEKIVELKRIIESKNGRIGTLEEKLKNAERDNRFTNEHNKRLVDIIDTKKARIIELCDENRSLTKDVTFYRSEIDKRDQRLDEKESKILNMQETIDFQGRHINRIEGELKLYKGMKVDNNKTDYNKPEKIEPLRNLVKASEPIGTVEYTKIDDDGTHVTMLLTDDAERRFVGTGCHINRHGQTVNVGDFVEPGKLRTMPDIDEMREYTIKVAHCDIKPNASEGHADPVGHDGIMGETGFGQNIPHEEPICKSVPSSAVVGKLNAYNSNCGNYLYPQVTFKLPKDALHKLAGDIPEIGKEYLIMPTDIYNDVLNKDLEEQIKKYRDMFDQYRYYSRFLDTPCLNVTPNTPSDPIPPVAKDYKAIGEHIHRKFEALMEAGFTEDQAMGLIPMWTDEEEN